MTLSDTKVLLVDDDPAMVRLLSKWLESGEYSVRTAGDGDQALTAIEEECPDILITDWEMPRMDGLELCRRVRQLDLPHYIYTIFLTVRSTPSEMIEGLEIGADDFLSKPVYQGELLARLRAGTRVVELERRLSLVACTDPLTGLLTRRTFFESMEKEWHRAGRHHLPLSCVMLDLDFFKRINDTHGHPVGDAVLSLIGDVLKQSCRASDEICRYGGEEFCVMLPETDEQEAAAWAERVRQRVASLIVPVGNHELQISGSFGVGQRHDDNQKPADLIDQADQALLCAKASGRNRVVRYQSLSNINELNLDSSGQQGGLFHGIVARHVMTPLVVCLREDETVGQAAEFFLRSRINSTPVVDADGNITGVLSEKDLLAVMVSPACWKDPVREVMRPSIISYDEDTPIQNIYEFICRVSIRRVVIVSGGRPTGTISRGTLLRWFKNLVTSKGLLEDEPVLQTGEVPDPHHSKQRLAETARELAHQATELERRFEEDVEDLVPYIVGGATGMQGLVNDLLAYSRFANQTTGLGNGMQSLLRESGLVD
ncbi:MAG: diguanylate cyclase [Thermoguttaceae bacterium]